jgi:hypothetical protein
VTVPLTRLYIDVINSAVETEPTSEKETGKVPPLPPAKRLATHSKKLPKYVKETAAFITGLAVIIAALGGIIGAIRGTGVLENLPPSQEPTPIPVTATTDDPVSTLPTLPDGATTEPSGESSKTVISPSPPLIQSGPPVIETQPTETIDASRALTIGESPQLSEILARTPPRLEADTAELVSRATVLIVGEVESVRDGGSRSKYARAPLGSGALIQSEGLVVTRDSVVTPSRLQSLLEVEEIAEGIDLDFADRFLIYVVDSTTGEPRASFEAVLKEINPTLQLAVLEITGNVEGMEPTPRIEPLSNDRSAFSVFPSRQVREGEPAHVLGFSGSESNAFVGIEALRLRTADARVSSIKRGELGVATEIRLVYPGTEGLGSLGSAVVDQSGNLIGVATTLRIGEHILRPVVIPANRIQAVLGVWSTTKSEPSTPASATPIAPSS